MIKLKNIAKIVFVALFVCVYSFETGAQLDPVYAAVEGLKDVPENRLYDALMTAMKSNLPVERHLEFMTKVSQTYPEKLAKLPQEQNKNLVAVTTGTNPMLLLGYKTPEEKAAEEKEKPMGLEIIAATQGVFLDLGKGSTSGTQGGSTNPGKGPSLQTSAGTNTQQDVSICSGKTGVFEDLVKAGVKIFNRLRDLIYVVAGFGIIAIAVGGNGWER